MMLSFSKFILSKSVKGITNLVSVMIEAVQKIIEFFVKHYIIILIIQ